MNGDGALSHARASSLAFPSDMDISRNSMFEDRSYSSIEFPSLGKSALAVERGSF